MKDIFYSGFGPGLTLLLEGNFPGKLYVIGALSRKFKYDSYEKAYGLRTKNRTIFRHKVLEKW